MDSSAGVSVSGSGTREGSMVDVVCEGMGVDDGVELLGIGVLEDEGGSVSDSSPDARSSIASARRRRHLFVTNFLPAMFVFVRILERAVGPKDQVFSWVVSR